MATTDNGAAPTADAGPVAAAVGPAAGGPARGGDAAAGTEGGTAEVCPHYKVEYFIKYSLNLGAAGTPAPLHLCP